MFQDLLGGIVEVYVNDVIVKSINKESHAADLEKVFKILKTFNMKMNPDKCTFGVTGGKFLGCMVSSKGIEANLEKMEAILNMKAPKTLNELQKLNGRIIALGQFISCSAKKCLPLF